ncbi:hypothetical protein OSB04_016173 [Centaurea solstitialis]|uniref:Uncharacterized protein n=1 Tax=Centaurea solstitialis TaxID=347529 RepID=A0AA38TKF5_9ASTR|nr:hypothetical protein OSB04_016173 [Centaurea solstitialis]
MALPVHLRYLAIWCSHFPPSICNLWSLQTLVLKTSFDRTELPANISDLVNLRHLWRNKVLFIPTINKPMHLQLISNLVLGLGVHNLHKCFPSIKKIEYTLVPTNKEIHFELLPYLTTFKLRVDYIRKNMNLWLPNSELNFRQNHIWFPTTLKKLTLVWCDLPWSDMSIIQSLPNLEVLKLKYNAFMGAQWDAREQLFPQLKFLRLEELNIKLWDAYSTSFPCLKGLSIRNCHALEEIPLDIGDIATLELIETRGMLNYNAMESVKRIQKEQHDEGNTDLKITINGLELSICLSGQPSSYNSASDTDGSMEAEETIFAGKRVSIGSGYPPLDGTASEPPVLEPEPMWVAPVLVPKIRNRSRPVPNETGAKMEKEMWGRIRRGGRIRGVKRGRKKEDMFLALISENSSERKSESLASENHVYHLKTAAAVFATVVVVSVAVSASVIVSVAVAVVSSSHRRLPLTVAAPPPSPLTVAVSATVAIVSSSRRRLSPSLPLGRRLLSLGHRLHSTIR